MSSAANQPTQPRGLCNERERVRRPLCGVRMRRRSSFAERGVVRTFVALTAVTAVPAMTAALEAVSVVRQILEKTDEHRTPDLSGGNRGVVVRIEEDGEDGEDGDECT